MASPGSSHDSATAPFLRPDAGAQSGDATSRIPASPRASLERAWRTEWRTNTVIVALMLTALDAFLLQRKHKLFTGGYLSADHLRGPGESIAFLAGSYLADVAVAGILVVASLALTSASGLSRVARWVVALAVAAGPLLVTDFVSYELLAHLGDAFDLGLMFNLVGRNPQEFLAVAGAHLWYFALGGLALATALSGLVWATHRLAPAGAWPRRQRLRWSYVLRAPLMLLAIALAVTTAMRLSNDRFENGFQWKPSGKALGAIAALITDVDGDGYGLLSIPPDPAPFDSRIHPYAIDWPGNGIDEDGLAEDLPKTFPAYTEPSGPPPVFRSRPDVVLVLLESFRGDVLGARHNGHEITPVLNALASHGVSSARAYSHNGYTVQSRYHLLTGSLVGLRGGTNIIDDFNANGYQTAYFSAQDESFGADALDPGQSRANVFYDARQDRDRRHTPSTPGSLAISHAILNERIHEFLERRSTEKPLFLFVNYQDTHFPYHHRDIEPLLDDVVVSKADIRPGRRDELWRMYANTAANVDRAIGVMLDDVRRTTGREPAVIITGDHGESLGDEGFLGHGYALNDVQTRTVLVVANLPMVIQEPWGHADLRDAVAAALARPKQDTRPRIEPRRSGLIQYIGGFWQPSVLGVVTDNGRETIDLRRGRCFRDQGGDRSQLSCSEPSIVNLVHVWESAMVASSIADSRPEPGRPAK